VKLANPPTVVDHYLVRIAE